jgi:tol-pal system-associated acyl-CoA thioesterase
MTSNLSATIRARAHRYILRVYYEDTDAGGVVYHANYLRFAERARTEALRDLGVPHAEMTAEFGLMFMVRRVKLDYLAPVGGVEAEFRARRRSRDPGRSRVASGMRARGGHTSGPYPAAVA